MKKKRIVIALGHRALGTTLPEQMKALREAVKSVADLIAEGANVVITHSNGAQVGMIHTAMNEFALKHQNYTGAPMSVCSAMSQGYIGYDIQSTLRAELLRRGIYKPVVTLITQVTVDPYDPALYQPTKVIGRVMTKEEAALEEEKGNFVTETEDGYRRIIAAPHPQEVIEIESIQLLLDAGQVVIAGGGGGIPVMEQGENLHGAGAVIEKDLLGGKMAELLHADEYHILTSVDQVSIGYQTEDPKPLGEINVETAKKYLDEKQFEPGTMRPKIEAAISFLEKGGSRAVITSFAHARDGYLGKAGTIITAE